MVKFAIVALCVTAAIAGAMAETPLEFGMEMSNRGLKAVCWFEYLKQFPNTDKDKYGGCYNGAEYISKEVNNPSDGNKAYFDFSAENKETYYGEEVPKFMNKLPSEYGKNCNQYAANRNAAPPANEGDALNDGGNDYPYKAFAYCLMSTLRSKHGDAAIEAVKSERTHSLKHWMTTLLDRENEFRARHGVEPLELVKDLSDAAQGWADTSADTCKMEHTTRDARKWNGEQTGESLSGGFGDPAASAYLAADGWYEENKDYPFAKGYQGDGHDALFDKIGHFTQSVWKGSKYVGYGYKFSDKCNGGRAFIVARYFPAGNMPGDFVKNVDPPKN